MSMPRGGSHDRVHSCKVSRYSRVRGLVRHCCQQLDGSCDSVQSRLLLEAVDLSADRYVFLPVPRSCGERSAEEQRRRSHPAFASGAERSRSCVEAGLEPEVMKNYYPERSISTSVRSENLVVEWDGKYQADHKACWKIFSDVNTRFQEQERVGPRGPHLRFGDQIGVRELIRNLAERDHRSAYAAAAEVARRAGVPTE